MDLNDKFNQMTTRIEVQVHRHVSQGTGFFYKNLGPKTGEGPGWRTVEGGADRDEPARTSAQDSR